MALGRTPGADPCGTQRGKGAAGERLPLSPRGAKRQRSAETRDSELGAGLRECRQQPEGIGALSSPGAQTPERSPPSQLPEASKPPASAAPQPPAARLAPLRQEAVPAPPRAAPTNWQKKIVLESGAGNLCPPYTVC